MRAVQRVAYIALGGNQGDTLGYFRSGAYALQQNGDLVAVSSVWCSPAYGPVEQSDFYNAVVRLDTELPSLKLLRVMQAVEVECQRQREVHWGPRTLDLDLLLYGDECCNSAELTLPHPGIPERDFVLWPLAEIAPDLCLPDGRSVLDLRSACPDRGIQRLNQQFYESESL